MGMLDDMLRLVGLGPKVEPDTRTVDEKLQDLKQQAEDAEKLANQTKEAWDYKKRIAQAQNERQKILLQAGGGQKKGLSRGQLIGLCIGAIIFLIILVKACG